MNRVRVTVQSISKALGLRGREGAVLLKLLVAAGKARKIDFTTGPAGRPAVVWEVDSPVVLDMKGAEQCLSSRSA